VGASPKPNFCLAQGYYALALSYAGRSEMPSRRRSARYVSVRAILRAIYYGIAAMPGSRREDTMKRSRWRGRPFDIAAISPALPCSCRIRRMSGDTNTAEATLLELRRTQPNISLSWIATHCPGGTNPTGSIIWRGFAGQG